MPGPRYVTDFEFPREAGFTGSADAAEGRTAVRPHTRQAYAKGGKVRRALAPKTNLKPSPGQVVGGTIAAGAAAAAYDKIKGDGEQKPRVNKRAEQLANQERAANYKTGGKVSNDDGGRKKYSNGGVLQKYARGGSVGHSAVQRTVPTTEADKEHGGKGPLLPGFKKGGRPARKSMGGPVGLKRGGKMKNC